MTPYRRPSRRSLAEIAVRVAAPPTSQGEAPVRPASGARELVVTSSDAVIRSPATVRARLNRIKLVHEGHVLHRVQSEARARAVPNGNWFAITAALQAGQRVIRVENAAKQSYEIAFIRRHPGKTTQHLFEWLQSRDGAPPGEIIGGVTPLARGVTNFVIADFPKGDYTLLCFVPDARDGKRRVAHAMVREMHIG